MKNGTLIKDIDIIKKVLGLNDLTFCSEIGISRSTLNRWVNEKSQVSNDNLEKIYSFTYKKGLRINRIKAQMLIDEAKIK